MSTREEAEAENDRLLEAYVDARVKAVVKSLIDGMQCFIGQTLVSASESEVGVRFEFIKPTNGKQ